ncbi:MAG TPA: alpha/beta fold hydrolase [Albitalea sp.]|nr:alpha/beta fold hydrolase [Albitalea sp.]
MFDRLPRLSRRAALLALGAASLLSACSLWRPSPHAAVADATPPIVFVHGNGDTAALWTTTIWRFESNGWPRDRLVAIDLPYPLARDDDAKPQEGRTSTTEHMQYLSAEVDKVLKATGASQVVLIGNSRGGNAIRNYIANGGGAAKVSHAVLGGTPNHGVWADAKRNPGNEFNGAGPFLTALNAPKGAEGLEVTPGVKWMTIRSDGNDKFAQPDGVWIGAKGVPTHVSAEGPALKGADNVVLPGVDHRETSYSPQAFAAAYRFITGRTPSLPIAPEASPVLNGKVSGMGLNNDPARGTYATNLPLAGATVEVYATDPATGDRVGAAVLRKTVGSDGLWGPLRADPKTPYEFVVSARGYATTHIYRSPFPRSSSVVNLRAERIADADRDAKSIVTLTRPRGYFGIPRDQISLDGKSPPGGIPPGVAGVSVAKLKVLDAAMRPVAGEFNGERIVGRAWPAANNEIVFLELHY